MKTRLVTGGFEKYFEAIAQKGKDIDAVCDQALAAGGQVLKTGMRRRVAKDTHNLENHIECSKPVKDGNVHYVDIGLLKGTEHKTAIYGNVQEFGSSDVHAHPYVRPTLDEDMGKARAAMRKIFKEEGAL
jgi:HK97 gp10 family phage protein